MFSGALKHSHHRNVSILIPVACRYMRARFLGDNIRNDLAPTMCFLTAGSEKEVERNVVGG